MIVGAACVGTGGINRMRSAPAPGAVLVPKNETAPWRAPQLGF